MNSVCVRTCLCPIWASALDLPPAVCFLSVLFRLMCPPAPFLPPLFYFHSRPTFTLSSIYVFPPTPRPPWFLVLALHALQTLPTSGETGSFFGEGNDTSWVERVMELVVKRNKSITLIGKNINFPLAKIEAGWLITFDETSSGVN